MSYSGTRGKTGLHSDETFGKCVSQPALPSAIRSLDDEELRTLLIALLYEWRQRTRESKADTLMS